MKRGVWGAKTRPARSHGSARMPRKSAKNDTHGPVNEQMFVFTGPRTGGPSSAPAPPQLRPRSATAAQDREKPQHGTPDASRPSGHGTGQSSASRPGTAPAATERPQQIPRRNAGHRNRPQLRHGPREAPARAARTGKPQDTPNAGTLDSRPGRAAGPARGPAAPVPKRLYIIVYQTSTNHTNI